MHWKFLRPDHVILTLFCKILISMKTEKLDLIFSHFKAALY